MNKIIFFEIENWERQFLLDNLREEEIILDEKVLERGESISQEYSQATILSVFAFSQLTKDVLLQFPNLQYIVTRSTGVDHIDLSYCKEKNILVSNVPAYGVHTIAEHTFALLLAITRKVILSVERTRKGNFQLEGLRGIELFGKTIGLIGLGNIGQEVMQIAKGFGMKVLVFTRHPDISSSPISFVSLDELLTRSDVISIHAPLTSETKYLINTENITKCKKGCIIINTARGPIVQTQAILEGLEKGIIAGAGLDVLEEEHSLSEERKLLSPAFLKTWDMKTQLFNHILLNREDVIVTPHNAFNSHEALNQILSITVENITSFIQGNPKNIVKF
jgi:D-lactate dehydrogenase